MRTNKLKNGALNTAALVRLRARLLKYTDALPEHVRSQYKRNVCSMPPMYATVNCIPDAGPIAPTLKARINSAKTALGLAFYWAASPEGSSFWSEIYESL